MKKVNAILLAFLLSIACSDDVARADAEAEQERGKANDKIVVGIMPFIKQKVERGGLIFIGPTEEELEDRRSLAREAFAQALAHSRTIAPLKLQLVDDVLATIQGSDAELLDIGTAVEVGRRLGAQYMILGNFVNFTTDSEVRGKGWFTREKIVVYYVTLNMKVIDVEASNAVIDMTG
jgi:hypothetical protein